VHLSGQFQCDLVFWINTLTPEIFFTTQTQQGTFHTIINMEEEHPDFTLTCINVQTKFPLQVSARCLFNLDSFSTFSTPLFSGIVKFMYQE
jgi:hypothetical protein